jgi:hypothetical protein
MEVLLDRKKLATETFREREQRARGVKRGAGFEEYIPDFPFCASHMSISLIPTFVLAGERSW